MKPGTTNDKNIPEKDPYEVLGTRFGASDAEISKAYRKLALKMHPDKTAHLPASEQEKIAAQFHDIQVARTFLLENPEGRRKYDSVRESKLAREAAEAEREKNMSQRRKRMQDDLAKAEGAVKTSKAQPSKSYIEELRRQGNQMKEEFANRERAANDDEEQKLRKRAKASLDERQIKLKWSRKKIKISPSEHSLAQLFQIFGKVESVEMLGSKGNLALITFENAGSCEAAVQQYATSDEMRASYVGQRKDREREKELEEPERSRATSESKLPQDPSDWKMRREAEREALLRQMEDEEGGKTKAVQGQCKPSKKISFPPDFPKEYGDLSPFEKLEKAERDVFSSLLSPSVWKEVQGKYYS